jgi:hypothetical protein
MLLLERLMQLYESGVPMEFELGNKTGHVPENVLQVISRTEEETIAPNSKKFAMFGSLSETRYNGDFIPKIAQALSTADPNRRPVDFFYSQDRYGFSSLLLDRLDCHMIYDSFQNTTFYFLLPRPVRTDLELD